MNTIEEIMSEIARYRKVALYKDVYGHMFLKLSRGLIFKTHKRLEITAEQFDHLKRELNLRRRSKR